MLNFVFILLIILEIFFTVFCVQKILICEKKVEELNEKVIAWGKIIIEFHQKLNSVIEKINKVVSIFTNKKFIQIKKIIQITIDIVQIIILFRSLDFSKGLKKAFNFKNAKKILLAQITRELARKVLSC